MSRGDIWTVGISSGARPFRVAASATRFYAGEPLMFSGTYSSGVATANTVVVLTDAKPVIGTDVFVGIASDDADVNSAGTVIAHKTHAEVPIANITLVRGKAKTVANFDADSEVLGILWDVVLFDLTSSVYTIDETAAADTSALTVVDGNPSKSLVDVTVDARAFRVDIS